MGKDNHLKKLEITNFRGLRNVALDDFALVNVLVGGNNVGKTTVLEALFLSSGIGRPDILYALQNLRYLDVKDVKDLAYFSHNLDFEEDTKLTCLLAGGTSVTVSIGIGKNNNLSSQPMTASKLAISSSYKEKSIFIKCEIQKNKTSKETVFNFSNKPSGEGVNAILAGNQNDGIDIDENIIITQYICAKLPIATNALDDIFKNKLDSKLIEYLKKFDSRIESIKNIENMLYVDIGLPRMLPLKMMGDGIVHNTNILAAMMDPDFKIILLDQIEDGLHHAAPEPLLKAILEIAQKENKQVFITTHNIEILQKFRAVLEEQKNMQDKFCLYALQRDKKGDVKPYRYRYSQFAAGILNDWEVR